ncbi:MAG: oxygenase MpaB family protein [Gemmatimonadetes bacterium]|nr:oxygenase MpaB family protein [Gemmatimonadota bacterium]
MEVPKAFLAGYEAARARDPELAETYIRHTTVGDPLADTVAHDLSLHRPGDVHSILANALESPESVGPGMPDSVREFVAHALDVPDWFDPEIARVASRAFLRNSDIVLEGLVGGSIVEGFSTLISKSFRIRGRVVSAGVRRLKANGMQLVEQYLPGGMEPAGDGWRLTLRVRLVHARSRHLISQSDEWDSEEYGVPISAAHLLLAAGAFSGRLMRHVAALGGDFSREEREAYVHVWRYTARLMGIPEEILFHDEASACHAFEIGSLCEPPADLDAIIMANSIVESAPVIVGVTEPIERKKLARVVTQASRELIGDELADQFMFPRRRKVLTRLRLRHRARNALRRILPRASAKGDLGRFEYLMDFASYDTAAFSYRLPTAVYDEDSAEW